MFNIKLYHFSKKTNSTKTPAASAGDTFSCLMKTSSSIINPVIEIQGADNSLLTYNYAYISSFGGRYYFIDNIVYEMGIYSLYLSVDVLATYKSDIQASQQYVIRCASSLYWDRNIIDTAYLTIPYEDSGPKKSNTKSGSSFPTWAYEEYEGIENYSNGVNYDILPNYTGGSVHNYFNVSFSDGDFVVGIVGNNATGMNYYVFSYAGFKELINKAFSLAPSNMEDVSSGVANALYDPTSYIVSARWFPEIPSQCLGSGESSIKIGNETISLTNTAYPLRIDRIPNFRLEIEVPNHPNGNYYNLSPYSEINFYFPPFGNFPIDTTKIYSSSSSTRYLNAYWAVDYSVGIAHLKISVHGTAGRSIITETTADYGVMIPISSLVTDWRTSLAATAVNFLDRSPIGGIVDKAGGYINKGLNWLSEKWNQLTGGEGMTIPASIDTGNKSLLAAAGDLLASANGQVQTVGSIGSFLSFNEGKPYIYAHFYYQCEKDEQRFGVPTNKKIILSNLSGYTLCGNAHVDYNYLNPTDTEATAVEAALNQGVFLE